LYCGTISGSGWARVSLDDNNSRHTSIFPPPSLTLLQPIEQCDGSVPHKQMPVVNDENGNSYSLFSNATNFIQVISHDTFGATRWIYHIRIAGGREVDAAISLITYGKSQVTENIITVNTQDYMH
ncbi:Megf8, partial [Acrasis kona]